MAKAVKVTKAKLPDRNKTSTKHTARLYTFLVQIECEIQYTFTGAEVQRDQEGGPSDLEPTDKALADLQDEIQEHIGGNYPVDKLEVFTDSDLLIGITDPPDEGKSPFSRPKRRSK